MALGGKRPGAGRPFGSKNKSKEKVRIALAAFVEDNSERFQQLLDRIEEEDGPLEAFKCIQSLLEFHVPKLSRADLSHEGQVTISKVLAQLEDPEDQNEIDEG